MTAIHIPGFNWLFHSSPKPEVEEPHWIDLTTTAADTGFAERSATYLASVGYSDDEVRRVLVEELQLGEEQAHTVVAGIERRELQTV